MAKIKVIQMTLAVEADGNEHAEYLDDKGRIWYQTGHFETLQGDTDRTWVSDWQQVELPEEPANE